MCMVSTHAPAQRGLKPGVYVRGSSPPHPPLWGWANAELPNRSISNLPCGRRAPTGYARNGKQPPPSLLPPWSKCSGQSQVLHRRMNALHLTEANFFLIPVKCLCPEAQGWRALLTAASLGYDSTTRQNLNPFLDS